MDVPGSELIVGYTKSTNIMDKPPESDSPIKQAVEDQKGNSQIISPPLSLSDINSYRPSQNSACSVAQPMDKKDEKGNLGEIIYIRQVHRRPEHSMEERIIVGKYQLRIWQELEKRRVKDIFLESLVYDDKESEIPQEPIDHQLEPLINWEPSWGRKLENCDLTAADFDFKFVFPKGIPQEPTDYQLEVLASRGGGNIYAAFHPDVNLYRTSTEKEAMLALEKVYQEGEDYDYWAMQKREEWAAREIRTFLEQDRGKRIILIYGAAHEFKDDFEKFESPVSLTEVIFPKILKEFPDRNSWPLNVKKYLE